MKLKDKLAVVTGGGNGIGRALCRRFAAEGARGVVVADLDGNAAATVAKEIGGVSLEVDVRRETDIKKLVEVARNQFGPIDLFCSNAGIGLGRDVDTPDADWQKIWEVNVLAHVLAARAVLPAMVERGDGYLLQTASAAGLLSQIGSVTYAVTKHAAVALAEWLSITYGPAIKVSCLCPQGVLTNMLMGSEGIAGDFLKAGALTPEQVAQSVIEGLDQETFLILPHPEVREYFARKGSDYDRWLRGMRRLQTQMQTQGEPARP